MLSRTLDQADAVHINMTPMVDVMLCLLIFFMAATKLYDWEEEQFQVQVPEVAEAAPLTTAPDDIEVIIVAPGSIRFGTETEPIDLDALRDRLIAARERYPAQGVTVRADRSLSYQAVADVLAVCELAEIRDVRLPVRPRLDPSSPNTP